MKLDKKIINYDKFGYPIYLQEKSKTATNIDDNGKPIYPKKEKKGLNDRDER